MTRLLDPARLRLLKRRPLTGGAQADDTRPTPPAGEAIAFAGPLDTSGPFLPDDVLAAFEEPLLEPIRTWFSTLTRRAGEAVDLDAASLMLLTWQAEQPVDQLARLLADALVLAGLTGRASVVDEAVADGVEGVSFAGEEAEARGIVFEGGPFVEALDFLRQKVALPQQDWQELLQAGHDRAFVVAGITSQQVAEDIQTLVIRNMESGGIDGFRSDLDQLVADGRWTGNPDMVIDGTEDAETLERKKRYRAWRSRTIFDTNLRTAQAAGRLKQQRALADLLPYFQYTHAATRTPRRPRINHVRLDGLTLSQDDPVWARIYAPNGWLCSCSVRAITQRMADRAPDTLRQPPTEAEIAQAVPAEWQYLPGDTWERGLVPQEQAGGLDRAQTPRVADPDLPPLASLAAPMRLPEPLPDDASEDDIAARFLAQFGASLERGVLYRDVAGQQITVSRQLLEDGRGQLNVKKRGRDRHMDRLAATLADPDEIWVDWAKTKDGSIRLTRTYLRHDPEAQLVTGFAWSRDTWAGTTAMTLDTVKGRVDMNAMQRRRHGALLYRRPSGD